MRPIRTEQEQNKGTLPDASEIIFDKTFFLSHTLEEIVHYFKLKR